MAIAYKSSGAGVGTETSGAACSPASPSTVAAGDILIIHAYFEGTTTTPDTPSGFTLLSGPHVIETTIGRHWVYGKIADGTEDGAANALGSQAVTTMRVGRCYSFSGWAAGSIKDVCRDFSHISHATDPQAPTVTTTETGALAVCLVAQNDDNTIGGFTGESGGNWTESAAEAVFALTPGAMLQIQTCIPTANPGTVSGGTNNTANDPVGCIGFHIRVNPLYVLDAAVGTFTLTGNNVVLGRGYTLVAGTGSFTLTGVDVTFNKGYKLDAATGTFALTGVDVALKHDWKLTATVGEFVLTGNDAGLFHGYALAADTGSFVLAGVDITTARSYQLNAAAGSFALTGPGVGLFHDYLLVADVGEFTLAGIDVELTYTPGSDPGLNHYVMDALVGGFALTGNAVGLVHDYKLTTQAGAFTLTGNDIGAAVAHRLSAALGSFVLTGNDVTLQHGYRMDVAAAGFVLTGQPVNFIYRLPGPAGLGIWARSDNLRVDVFADQLGEATVQSYNLLIGRD